MAGGKLIAGLLAASVAAIGLGGVVLAHGDDTEYSDPGSGMGYPMEQDSMEEHCPGSGMMHGGEMSHGMKHGYDMRHDFMDGDGMGHHMMGGYRMGYGMMSPGMMSGVELDRDQRRQMLRIQSELRKQNWALQGKILDAQDQLYELYSEGTLDAKKIGAVYAKIFDLRRQMIESAVNARNRQRAILTDEQRDQLGKGYHGSRGKSFRPGDTENHHHRGMMGG